MGNPNCLISLSIVKRVLIVVVLAIALIISIIGCTPTAPSDTPTTYPPEAVSEPRLPELIVVYDNSPFDSRLRTDKGFSCLIRLAQNTILFDVGGDTSTLLHNMRQLDIDPREVDTVVLSHRHNDHVGGLSEFLEQNSAVTVYLPQSFSRSFKDKVKSLGAKIEEVYEARELFAGVYTTGELGTWIKEQSLIITTPEGLVVITGCAHPGVVNIVRRAKDIVPDAGVYLVTGGFHLSGPGFFGRILMGKSSAEIESIMKEFIQLSVEKVALSHCSGDKARRLFSEGYGEGYIESGVGRKVPLP